MHEVLPGLWRLSLLPLDALNVYLLGKVLVDTGAPFTKNKLLKRLEGKTVEAVAVTHAHFDHQGACGAVCNSLDIPLWCGSRERTALENADLTQVMSNPESLIAKLGNFLGGPGYPVTRSIGEGDEVGGFTVVETPGHTPGHLSFWREGDGALVLGDVLFHRNPVTLRRGLQEPFRCATFDLSQNRESARKVSALKPSVICFGHGEPLRDGDLFSKFVSSLPRS